MSTLRIGQRTLSLIAVVALVAVACTPAAPAATEQPKITIKLAENSWTGSSVNVNVAKIILEQELGYEVEIVTIDERNQWPALATGDLSASLEVWPSGHQEAMAQYVDDQKVVDNIGELGVVGKIGWYIPSYLLTDHPELATFEGFQNADDAALFKTAESGDAGQFLAGDPAWVQYDADIIENLGMNLKIVNAGSEQAILAALDAAYSREEPILFYFWTPHSIHAKYDLTEVKLPDYSDACYAGASTGGVDCDYPPDVLLKIAWSGLKDAAPDAYEFLENFKYTNQDQIDMIAAVELNKAEVAQAARDWVDAHEDVWKAWLPK
jgi:glycine betaine/proline transport system substrate-binding protein